MAPDTKQTGESEDQEGDSDLESALNAAAAAAVGAVQDDDGEDSDVADFSMLRDDFDDLEDDHEDDRREATRSISDSHGALADEDEDEPTGGAESGSDSVVDGGKKRKLLSDTADGKAGSCSSSAATHDHFSEICLDDDRKAIVEGRLEY